MYRVLKRAAIKKMRLIRTSLLLLVIALVGYVGTTYVSAKGLDQKWATAFLGTIVPFSFVIYFHRNRLLRWSFWTSLLLCFSIHVIAIWICFQYFLAMFRNFSPLLWYPVMLFEMFALLISQKRIEEMLTGERYTMTLHL